jgi:hypothetical protein
VNVTDVADRAKLIKGEMVAAAPPGFSDDLCPTVLFERDGLHLAVAVAPHVERDEGLNIVSLGTPGFGATEIGFTVDAHYTRSPFNPLTGEAWGEGEMQELCDHHSGCEIGVTTDCLMVMVFGRDGKTSWANLPYHIDKKSGTVHWLPTEEYPDDIEVRGLVPDTIRAALAIPPVPCPAEDRDWADAVVATTIIEVVGATVMMATSKSAAVVAEWNERGLRVVEVSDE